MFPIKFELRRFGLTHIIVRPDGQLIPCFINLAVELRRRLRSSANDEKVVLEALQQRWAIVEIFRLTVLDKGITQRYRIKITAERYTFGGTARVAQSVRDFLRQLENELPKRVQFVVKLVEIRGDNLLIIKTQLNNSADFARLFIRHVENYNKRADGNRQ